MTLFVTTIRSTGSLNPSVREDSATGLRTYRTGLYHVTDIGVLLLISGSVSAVTESVSVRVKSLRTSAVMTQHLQLNFTDLI